MKRNTPLRAKPRYKPVDLGREPLCRRVASRSGMRVLTPHNREAACADARRAPDGWVQILREPTRSDDQNRKLHAMIEDLRQQIPGGEEYSKEDWKLRLMQSLRNETRFLPELEGAGMFPVGQKTSELTKPQFATLVEIVFAYGAKHGVRWSDPAERIFAEYGHGKKAA